MSYWVIYPAELIDISASINKYLKSHQTTTVFCLVYFILEQENINLATNRKQSMRNNCRKSWTRGYLQFWKCPDDGAYVWAVVKMDLTGCRSAVKLIENTLKWSSTLSKILYFVLSPFSFFFLFQQGNIVLVFPGLCLVLLTSHNVPSCTMTFSTPRVLLVYLGVFNMQLNYFNCFSISFTFVVLAPEPSCDMTHTSVCVSIFDQVSKLTHSYTIQEVVPSSHNET